MTEEIPPIRCYNCGKPLISQWNFCQDRYMETKDKSQSLRETWEKYNMKMCCRTNLMSPDLVLIPKSTMGLPPSADLTYGVETQYSNVKSTGHQIVRVYNGYKRVDITGKSVGKVLVEN